MGTIIISFLLFFSLLTNISANAFYCLSPKSQLNDINSKNFFDYRKVYRNFSVLKFHTEYPYALAAYQYVLAKNIPLFKELDSFHRDDNRSHWDDLNDSVKDFLIEKRLSSLEYEKIKKAQSSKHYKIDKNLAYKYLKLLRWATPLAKKIVEFHIHFKNVEVFEEEHKRSYLMPIVAFVNFFPEFLNADQKTPYELAKIFTRYIKYAAVPLSNKSTYDEFFITIISISFDISDAKAKEVYKHIFFNFFPRDSIETDYAFLFHVKLIDKPRKSNSTQSSA